MVSLGAKKVRFVKACWSTTYEIFIGPRAHLRLRIHPPGLDKGGYCHELFLRGKQFLAAHIDRIQIKGKSSSRKSVPSEDLPDLYALPFLPGHQAIPSPLISRVQHNSCQESSTLLEHLLLQSFPAVQHHQHTAVPVHPDLLDSAQHLVLQQHAATQPSSWLLRATLDTLTRQLSLNE